MPNGTLLPLGKRSVSNALARGPLRGAGAASDTRAVDGQRNQENGTVDFRHAGELITFIERIAVLLALIRTSLRIHPSFFIRTSSDINALGLVQQTGALQFR
jgi:hypothetical protein